MVAQDDTSVLPRELLLAVFDLFSVTELAPLRRVNKRWRDTATAHPCYWRFPKLCGSSPAEMSFFLARLTAAAGKPLGIFVNQLELFPALQTTIFPALSPHLPNIEHLQLCLHIDHAPVVFGILRGPTHSLKFLQLDFRPPKGTEGSCPTAAMPCDILKEGRLDTLVLRNVDLPESAPASFASVQLLVFGHSVKFSRTTLHDLITACPRARDVTLTDLGVRLDHADWPLAWQFLDSLSLIATPLRVRAAVVRLPLARVAHLTVAEGGHLTFARLFAHLDGPLNLSCQAKSGPQYVLHIHSWTTLRMRSFRGRRIELKDANPGASLPRGILDFQQLAPRLRSMDIAASLWSDLVPLIPDLVDAFALTVVLDPVTGLAPLHDDNAGTLSCPVLIELHLYSLTGLQAVTADDVRKLILERLRLRSGSGPILILEGVYLSLEDRVILDCEGLVCWIEDVAPGNIYPSSLWHARQ